MMLESTPLRHSKCGTESFFGGEVVLRHASPVHWNSAKKGAQKKKGIRSGVRDDRERRRKYSTKWVAQNYPQWRAWLCNAGQRGAAL